MNYLMNKTDKEEMLKALSTTLGEFVEKRDRWNICIQELMDIIDRLESDLS